MFPGFGTLVNASLIVVGSFLGIKAQRYIPHSIKEGTINAIGLFTLILGIKLLYENRPETLKVFFLLTFGSILGHLIKLEEKLQELLKGSESTKGFMSASLLFTVGPMTLLGCILEGSKADSSLLLSKAFMDGFSSVILASSMGKGVAFSALFVLVFQGMLTFLAFYLGSSISQSSMANTLFIGGGLIILTSAKIFGLLDRVKLLNIFPSLVISLFV
jgi:uncharacterized membrane protein YqgA involved in biofilm formation